MSNDKTRSSSQGWTESVHRAETASVEREDGYQFGTTRGVSVGIASSDRGTEASVSGKDHHEVLEKIEQLRQIAVRCVEPDLADGAGI